MLGRLTALLYLLTAAASLNAGLATFKSERTIPSPVAHAWLVSGAFFGFIVPTIYLLASTSVFATARKPRASRWVASTVVLLVSTLILVQQGFGWKFIAEVVGPLTSITWIIGSLAQVSTIVLVGTAVYIFVQGQILILTLQMYWGFGGSVWYVLMQLATPALVLASLIVAVSARRRNRSEMDSRPN